MVEKHHIITAARGWLGTRFVHQGRVKRTAGQRGGCDCIGLIIGVAEELGIECNGLPMRALDDTGYARIPDGKRLYQAFCQHTREIAVEDAVPGDVLMFRFNEYPQHVAFMSDYSDESGVIHCTVQTRKVVEHRLDESWRARICAAFSIA